MKTLKPVVGKKMIPLPAEEYVTIKTDHYIDLVRADMKLDEIKELIEAGSSWAIPHILGMEKKKDEQTD